MNRIIKYVLKHKLKLSIGTISMFIVIAADLCIPYMQKEFLDGGIIKGNHTVIIYTIAGILLMSLIKATFGYCKEYYYDLISSDVHEDIKNDLFNHLQKLEFKYFDGMNTGELMSRIGEDAENIWQTIGYGLRLFVENIIYFVFSTIILFSLNWELTLACIVVMIPIGIIEVKLEKVFGNCYGKISDKTAEINTTAQENIAGVRLVKAFAREKYEISKLLKMNREYYDLNMEQGKAIGRFFPPIEFLTNMSLIIMITLGGYLVMKKTITLGVLVAFSGYIWNLIWPMRMLGELTDMISRTIASAKKIFNIIDRLPVIKSNENCYNPEKVDGTIEFKNVCFKYDNENVLEDISIKIAKGSTVAIMGTTGSGKSTLVNLIGRYYDVHSGEIFIDGVNIKDYDLQVLRSNMSIVPQESFLFSDTIFNNITFSNNIATFDDVKDACTVSCCINFIENLPDGFNTEIGERGIGLSGGQKQRISIARALVRKAPIMILDDATSALDMETEHTLLQNLKSNKRTCTTFLIAHRISAVKDADMILYLEDGKIKENGTHKELLDLKGAYYNVYCEQFKDFKDTEIEVV
ncbi:ABC transporter, permease/ATP-binding protein [Clostridium bornimense]|uniref:ABC transporter, permease/ATP-binding protein n=1 Tax=Clostridium bornimense TaxID=1216932 RepID=W6SK42_9CLOT|nr:ABC transporter ATP-binding protein [Clostridium bornimense]CDM70170.1 ABC transporter, permease/ATP-binding protein [Clostridium bornimense]